jgi:hypothetical protein
MNDKHIFHLSNIFGLFDVADKSDRHPQTDLPDMSEDDFTIPFITAVVETTDV